MAFSRVFRHVITLALCTTLTGGLAACGGGDGGEETPSPTGTSSGTDEASAVSLAAFLPQSEGAALADSTTPVGTWDAFTDSLESTARSLGVSDITIARSRTLADQCRRLEEYLEDTASQDGEAAGATTLVFVPAGQSTQDSRKYSELIIRTGADAAAGSATPAPGGTGDASASPSPASSPSPEPSEASDSASGSSEAPEASLSDVARLLRVAQGRGMRLVTPSDAVPGVVPSVSLDLPTAEAVGRLQAQFVVTKLRLAAQSGSVSPKAVEVLLPYGDDPSFAREAFAGIWDVLGPYFQSGRVYSPSGLLSSSSSAGSWRAVAFAADGADGVRAELAGRLDASGYPGVGHVAVDAVVCLGDVWAQGAVEALRDAGYSGSSASVNPDAALPGIVDTLRGRKDVSRGEVPAPASSASPSPGVSDGSAGVERAVAAVRGSRDSQAWPLVTGYGCVKAVLPSVVNGSQWLTGLDDPRGYGEDCARAAAALASGVTAGGLYDSVPSLVYREGDGGAAYAVSLPLTGIHAGNIKSALIDRGYATAADAGL